MESSLSIFVMYQAADGGEDTLAGFPCEGIRDAWESIPFWDPGAHKRRRVCRFFFVSSHEHRRAVAIVLLAEGQRLTRVKPSQTLSCSSLLVSLLVSLSRIRRVCPQFVLRLAL